MMYNIRRSQNILYKFHINASLFRKVLTKGGSFNASPLYPVCLKTLDTRGFFITMWIKQQHLEM